MVSADEILARNQLIVDTRLYPSFPEIDSTIFPAFVFQGDIKIRLAFMYGFNSVENRFIPLSVDAAGNIQTSPAIPTTFKSFKQTVTDTGFLFSFGATFLHFLIINDGPNSVYIAFNRAATTNDIEIKSGETLSLDIQADTIGAITATGETATLRIIGTR